MLLRPLVWLPALLLTATLALVAWLLLSSAGSHWLLARVTLPPQIQYAALDGNLWQGLEFTGVAIDLGDQELAAEQLTVRLRPEGFLRGVQIHKLDLQNVTVTLQSGAAQDTARTQPPPLDLADWSAPLPITLHESRAAPVTFSLPSGDELRLEELTLRGRWDQALEDVQLAVAADWLDLELSGELVLAEGRTNLELSGFLDGRVLHEALPDDLQLTVATSGSDAPALEVLDFRLSSVRLGLLAEGRVHELLGAPRGSLSLALENFDLAPLLGQPLDLAQVNGSADWRPDRVTVSLQGQADGYAADDASPLHFKALEWQLDGSLDRTTDGNVVQLQALELRLGDALLQAGGQVLVPARPQAEPDFDLQLEWSALQWPLAADSPGVSSPEGAGRLRGTVDDWRFEGRLGLDSQDYPGGTFALQAAGDSDGLRLDEFDGAFLGGQLRGDGAFRWAPDMDIQAQLALQTLDLAALLPDWPAVLSGDLTVALSGGGAPATGDALPANGADVGVARGWAGEISSTGLNGQLFGEALQLRGTLDVNGDRYALRDGYLRAGASTVQLDGTLSESLQVDADLQVQSAGWLAQRLGGAWAGRVQIDTAGTFPVLAADLTGRDIGLGGLRAQSATLEREAGAPQAGLVLQGATFNDRVLDELVATLSLDVGRDSAKPEVQSAEQATNRGRDRSLALTLQARSERLRLSAATSGALVPDLAGGPGWEGTLDQLMLEVDEAPLLTLSAPAPLVLAMNRQELLDACLAAATGGTACLDVRPDGAEGLTLGADLDALSLALLDRWFDHGLISSQALNGTFDWRIPASGPPSGEAQLTLSAGEVADPERDELALETGPGTLRFRLEEGRLDDGLLDLPLPGAGYLRATFEVDGLQLDGTGRVRGQLDVAIDDLALLDDLLSPVDRLAGRLRTSLTLGGVTGDPSFDGDFDLSGVAFRVPAFATSVSDLSLRGRVRGSDELNLRGRYSVGAGEGTLSVLAQFADWTAPQLNTQISGTNLELVRLSDLQLDLSPDLRLDYARGAWTVAGRAEIPRALVTPLTSFVSGVSESEDVEIVAGTPSGVQSPVRARPAEIYGVVDLSLGEAVDLRMDIADVALGGGAELRWNGDLLPTADGEVSVNGTVTAWGPRLTITGGRVRWNDDPVSNPDLDLRAQRDVFGNTLVRTAGVRVSGKAQRPDVDAYTQPLTTSERAWAVLLVGSDVNFAQGVGAFDVGAYIAPRVFLSYGISFFDSENVVGLRYDLRRGWGVKATSGQSESGIDLSYTIEK